MPNATALDVTLALHGREIDLQVARLKQEAQRLEAIAAKDCMNGAALYSIARQVRRAAVSLEEEAISLPAAVRADIASAQEAADAGL